MKITRRQLRQIIKEEINWGAGEGSEPMEVREALGIVRHVMSQVARGPEGQGTSRYQGSIDQSFAEAIGADLARVFEVLGGEYRPDLDRPGEPGHAMYRTK